MMLGGANMLKKCKFNKHFRKINNLRYNKKKQKYKNNRIIIKIMNRKISQGDNK